MAIVANSDYTQQSFVGGMNLLLDDTRLAANQYRIGFNVRNRYDRLDLILQSAEDTAAPAGLKQEMTTFGDYEILFVAGKAYYKLFTDTEWNEISGFQMASGAPRLWTKAVPIAETNYYRLATSQKMGEKESADSRAKISLINVAGASQGNLPGLVVQDNINQPLFIFIGSNGLPTWRTTQSFDQWKITFTDESNTVVATNGDNREYVPIGNCMEYLDGILYIASPDGTLIYQSVTGRPLDFVRNVSNLLAGETTSPPFTQYPGGDAQTTAYSVGVGNIRCLRAMSDNALFVAAGNATFALSKNMANIAPTVFGEYTLIRKFLFNSVCLSDRAIFDSIGDTRFIDLTGVRSFNAIAQSQGSQGRNSVFTSAIQSAFTITDESNSIVANIIQSADYSAAILYQDYELYAVTTVFGPAIAVYDTINSCWVGFDISQTNGSRIKAFAKIELESQALFVITESNKVYQLYAGPGTETATVRTVGICASSDDGSTRFASPRKELQAKVVRVVLNTITHDCSCSFSPYINNRLSSLGKQTKNITFAESPNPTSGALALSDVDTQLENLMFSLPNCEQGWKLFGIFEWTGGSITHFSIEPAEITPMNPLNSQVTE